MITHKQQYDQLSDLLPWAALIAPGVVLNKDGSFQKTIHFRGPDLASSTAPQLVVATARLNNLLKRLGNGWAFFIEAKRSRAEGYPESGCFPDPVSLMIDIERAKNFASEHKHFESNYYLSLVYLPAQESVSKLSHMFVKKQNKEKGFDYQQSLVLFQETVQRVLDILKDIMFQADYLDDAATLSYLHDCISDKDHAIRVPDAPMYLDAVLADTPLVGGLEPKLGRHHLRTLTITGLPSITIPAILDQLNHLPLEYRWVNRYLPMDKLDAEGVLKSYRRQWFAKRKGVMNLLAESFSRKESAMVDTAAVLKSQDAEVALQELADDCVSFGYFTATISVWDEDKDVVEDKLREIEKVINGMGFATVYEQINAVEAWLSSLPGHSDANVRKPIIHSLNLAHMLPLSAVWSGPKSNPQCGGPVLMQASTRGNTPFRFSHHIGDVGHQMLIGPTGAGKSVLLNMIAMQFLRYDKAKVFVFDKGGSFLASTLGVNGRYYQVGEKNQRGLVFAPLMQIDNESERLFILDWLVQLIESERLEITAENKEALWSALNHLASVPASQRTLTGLKALVQDKAVRLALDHYTVGGPYGDLFDADEDQLRDGYWQCFEMASIMQTPNLVAPVLTYLFHAIEKQFDGRPCLLVLDEAWLFLDNPYFAARIRQWLKTLRKHNVSVIFSTQSVEDLLVSNISAALIESCPSRVFLPNDRAFEPQIKKSYDALGLNERQLHIITNAINKCQYYFESPLGNALFDMQLTPLQLAFASHMPEEQQLELWQMYNSREGHKDFLEKFLHYKQLDQYQSWLVDSEVLHG